MLDGDDGGIWRAFIDYVPILDASGTLRVSQSLLSRVGICFRGTFASCTSGQKLNIFSYTRPQVWVSQ